MPRRNTNPTDILATLKQRLLQSYSEQDAEKIFEGFALERCTTLRVNTIKTSPDLFEQRAKDEHVIVERVPWYPLAYILRSPSLREFSESRLYKDGWCYVQSLSSMLPPLILNPQKGERILDLCAAPGSKTSQIASMMENTGEIIANDASHTRIYRLEANLNRLGVTNATIIRSVGQGLWQKYPEHFDKTLVDVPCSMEGRIKINDPKTYADWSVKKIKHLQETQKFLLRSGISATKPGGVIVYATCTLSKQENEDVIAWILKKEQGKVALEEIDLEGVQWMPGIDMPQAKKIFPSAEFEGFFIAKLKKLSSSF